ncbi:tyrosine-type recombinase/integrase [Bacteriovoracaceae bacterium]|nr:tyrosine-type recombinase/integrase [Bacteriovoracaceae bacterium]
MKIKAKIYKKSSTGKWTLNYIEPKTEKRVRKSFNIKRAASVYLDELQNSLIQKKRNRDQDKAKLGSIIDSYIEKYPESSFLKVKFYVELFRGKFGKENPKKITPTVLQEWLIEIRKEYNLSVKTLGNMKGQLQVIFTHMKREGYIAANPFKKIKFRNRIDVYRRNKLSQEDMKKIFENLYYYSPYFLYRFIYVMYYTGMTKIELARVKHEHFDYEAKRINIVSPRAGFVRSFVIEDHVAELLKGQPKRNEYLMTNRLGRVIDTNHICRHLRRFRERYPDTPDFNMDSIRNAFAFHFLERGRTLTDLSVILGHSNRDHTVRLYGRPRRIFLQNEAATNELIMSADWGIEVTD